MPSLRRSLVLSFAQQYTGLLITVPTIMVLARFLTPKETGIFSLALALTNLVHVVRDFGVADYLVQERELTREKVRAAFTVTAATAWCIALALFVSGPAVAAFYDQPGVKNVLYVLALNFALIPFGGLVMSLMRREMAYGKLYVINTISSVFRSATSVTLAVLGFSYMSLAWGSLAGVFVISICAAYIRPRETFILPGLKEWRAVLSFGSKRTFLSIMTTLGNNANDIIVGRMLGLAAAGLFSRGVGLVRMFKTKFQGAIGGVMYPAFAAYNRGGKNANKLFAKSISYMTAIAWPFYVFAAIMADPIILAAFGPQWTPAAPILRIIAIAAAIGSLNLYTDALLMATGHINSILKVQTIVQPLRIGLIVVGSFYSLEAVAATQIAVNCVAITLQYRQLRKHLGLRFFAILRSSDRSAVIMLTSNLLPALIYALYDTGQLTNPWVAVIAAGIGWAAGWLAGACWTGHPIMSEVELGLNRFRAGRYLLRFIT